MNPVRLRAGVVLVEAGRLALIRRVREGHTYFVFPGGGVEPDEAIEAGARREALEELGLEVVLERLVAEVRFDAPTGESRQVYFWAHRTKGRFGTGTGPEMEGRYPAERGTYHAEWVALDKLAAVDVRPRILADQLLKTPEWPTGLVLSVHERG
jgi:8-oxo-dGTP diphosphatase